MSADRSPGCGPRVLITGAGSGIGRAIALRLAYDAGEIVLVGRRRERLEETASLCDGDARRIVCPCDVGDARAVAAVFARLADEVGALDGVVNNAGKTLFGRIEDISLADWDRVLATNLSGPFLVTRAALPLLRRGEGRSVVFVASTIGIVGLKGAAAYCAAKAGAINLMRVLALDHADEGIRVNAIAPGVVDTAMVDTDRRDATSAEARRKELAELHPLGRLGEPGDIAEAVAFLLDGRRSGFMTGSVMTIDGGLTAGFER